MGKLEIYVFIFIIFFFLIAKISHYILMLRGEFISFHCQTFFSFYVFQEVSRIPR